jgi:hypothetical protein
LRVRVFRDEAYPVFVVARNEERWEFEVELTEEESNSVQKAKQDFDKAQEILAQAYEKAQQQVKP